MENVRGTLSTGQKNYLLGRQWGGRCNNRPDSQDISFGYLENGVLLKYYCPMWRLNDGLFDQGGYEADHVIELAAGGTNDITNFQLICPSCHAVKTKNFMRQPVVNGRREFTAEERMSGRAYMDELENDKNTHKPQMRIKKEDMEMNFGRVKNSVELLKNEINFLKKIKE